MVEIMIGTTGKWSGRRLAKSVEYLPKRKSTAKWRVVLANGQKIFVEDVEILKEIENKS
jgi:hypothetical protein